LPVQERAPVAQRVPIVGALVVSALLASCSGSSAGSKASPSGAHPGTCTFVARLDAIANSVAQADVHDPNTFKRTLDTAVRDYVTNVRDLRAVTPVELHDGLERVEADVQQYRFDAALTDRAELDAYAARSCGRSLKTVTATGGPTTGGSLPSTTTTAPAASTPTTTTGG
jgi:hypothetical protein